MGIAKPFICVDLRQWLPHWAANESPSGWAALNDAHVWTCICGFAFAGDDEEAVSGEVALVIKAMSGATKPKKAPLNPAQWSLAFDAFALGAAACGMLSFPAAMSHKVVHQVLAHSCGLGKRMVCR